MKPTVVSLFAGAGGSSMGYILAGFKPRLAVEWDDHAAACYRLNFPETPVYHGDVGALTDAAALEKAGLVPGELDVLDGSPPCQGFSTAGKRQLADGRNRLFLEYVRLLKAFRPRAMVMENVPGIALGKMKIVFLDVMAELRAAGYRVRCAVLNAADYGVPQTRRRAIFIGIREDLPGEPSFPKPCVSRHMTVAEALGAVDMWQLGTPRKAPRADGTRRPGMTVCKTPGGMGDTFGGPMVSIYALAGQDAGEKIAQGGRPAPTLMKASLGNVWSRCVGLHQLTGDKRGELASGNEPSPTVLRAGQASAYPTSVAGMWMLGGMNAGVRAVGPDDTSTPVLKSGLGGPKGCAVWPSNAGIGGGMNTEDSPKDMTASPPAMMRAGIGDSHRVQFQVADPGPSPMAIVLPAPRLTGKALAVATLLKEGANGQSVVGKKGGWYSAARQARGEAAPTILKAGGLFNRYPGLRHPVEVRGLSVGEVMRLQSFPDDYQWPEGTSWASGWARVGNSVPPLMMRAVAEHIRVLLATDSEGPAETP